MSEIDVFQANSLVGIPHGFLGRRGGVSTGIHSGLNVGVGSEDDPEAVTENRRRAAEAVLPGAALATVYQVHSADVVVVDCAVPLDQRPAADALVTTTPGVLLGILTADCAPVLFVAAMCTLGADRSRIRAAIGPCISRASYEVDEGFAQRFEADDPANERFFSPGRAGHYQFDLEGYVAHRLAAAGLATVTALGLDTYADAAGFYSFRRATHRGEPGYGRQISLIGLPISG